MQFPDLSPARWRDDENNPIVGYFFGEKARYAIGDPQILVPGDFDEQWHMFYHGFFDDYVPYLYHLVSPDGRKWSLKKHWQIDTGPVCLFKDGDVFILYTSEIIGRLMKKRGHARNPYGRHTATAICVRTSTDLEEWSEPHVVMLPDLSWETIGPEASVRNPSVVKLPNGRFRMYYSGGTVRLPVCGYPEPTCIGVAESDCALGGFVKRPDPILYPDTTIPYRNLACGGFKVFGWEGKFLALYNPICIDAEGKPRSAIAVMLSDDGLAWQEAPYNPILSPGAPEWKKALVYQLDCVTYNGETRIYYNSRDEWLDGIERIGLSFLPDPSLNIYKLR